MVKSFWWGGWVGLLGGWVGGCGECGGLDGWPIIFSCHVAGTVTETVQVDRELGERDNMEDVDEPGITLFAVTEENGEHGNLDFDKFILTYTRRSKFEYDIK